MTQTLGFTGTRRGMTPAQTIQVGLILADLSPPIARHGDCIGSDEQFHMLCRALPKPVIIIGHPPIKVEYRAWCKFDITMLPQEYLQRDRDIVAGSDRLLATPRTKEPTPHSGTWYTIRRARDKGIHTLIVNPDGSTMHYYPQP